jgi:hypothetical protein
MGVDAEAVTIAVNICQCVITVATFTVAISCRGSLWSSAGTHVAGVIELTVVYEVSCIVSAILAVSIIIRCVLLRTCSRQ